MSPKPNLLRINIRVFWGLRNLRFFIFGLFLFSFFNVSFADKNNPVLLKWYGQSCFKIADSPTNPKTTLIIDPYGPQVGYPIKPIKANWVFVSHEHFDHNNVSIVAGAQVLRGLTEDAKHWNIFTKKLSPQVSLYDVGVYHDTKKGKERGLDAVSVITVNGVRIVHLGDLGHRLTGEQLKAIGPVDVLLIPVGGTYTIDAKDAVAVMGQLHPKVIVPMHYKTHYTPSIPLHRVTDFIQEAMSHWPIKTVYSSTLIFSKDKLPDTPTVYILSPLTPDQPFSL